MTLAEHPVYGMALWYFLRGGGGYFFTGCNLAVTREENGGKCGWLIECLRQLVDTVHWSHCTMGGMGATLTTSVASATDSPTCAVSSVKVAQTLARQLLIASADPHLKTSCQRHSIYLTQYLPPFSSHIFGHQLSLVDLINRLFLYLVIKQGHPISVGRCNYYDICKSHQFIFNKLTDWLILVRKNALNQTHGMLVAFVFSCLDHL